jgi:hypothetical protein
LICVVLHTFFSVLGLKIMLRQVVLLARCRLSFGTVVASRCLSTVQQTQESADTASRKRLSPEEAGKAFDEELMLAVKQVQACSIRHFNESVDIALNLLIEKNRLQDVRGIVHLPYGTGLLLWPGSCRTRV